MVIERLWPIERRVLGYLDQRGPSHRERLVIDLSSDESKLGRRRDRGHLQGGGSNGAIPLIMGAWCRRLIKEGWVKQISDPSGFYRCHQITPTGRDGFRRATFVP
jgi:hypothetical protein